MSDFNTEKDLLVTIELELGQGCVNTNHVQELCATTWTMLKELQATRVEVAGLRDHPSAVQFWKDAYENLKRELAELLEREDR